MTGHAPAGSIDEIQRMQNGVRDWVLQTTRRGKDELRTASPAILLSLLCASAFCPHGPPLAGGAPDGTVRLWNLADPAHPRRLGQLLSGGTSTVSSVAFSPDGHTLASGGYDATVRLWNPNIDYAIDRICTTAG